MELAKSNRFSVVSVIQKFHLKNNQNFIILIETFFHLNSSLLIKYIKKIRDLNFFLFCIENMFIKINIVLL